MYRHTNTNTVKLSTHLNIFGYIHGWHQFIYWYIVPTYTLACIKASRTNPLNKNCSCLSPLSWKFDVNFSIVAKLTPAKKLKHDDRKTT